MKKSKRIKITVETERFLTISRRTNLTALCLRCGLESRMLTVDEAAALARVSSLTLYRLIEAGTLHYTETTTGALLVCAASLENLISTWKGELK